MILTWIYAWVIFVESFYCNIYQSEWIIKAHKNALKKKKNAKNAIVYMAIIWTWNDIQEEMKGVMLKISSLVKLKSLLIEFYLNVYKTS